ncbi:uncharacterized protein K452DRAFT_317240 [Aplosporella prunicola CBS 121167]|uniref:Uncharacterized protein n=1 Tax=Aplosporella prunicola CBS 121167 TaxID=1176127 RepID=A0A6A6BI31_9PEZI|nr:uncharacterized protein K452DRAFT_317240 [Aplosporella prunicola CBS 121167]KAF2143802.1 hypothetical protein K452DRAFT_317240 [Aplosporella prunicola CBS 121167]
MAEQITHDVVNEAQSMGDPSPIDANATTTKDSPAGAAPDTTIANNKSSSDTPAITPSTASGDTAPQDRNPPSNPPTDETKTEPAAITSEQAKDGEGSSAKSKESTTNGTPGDQSASEDLTVPQAAADTSGGSDTDTSRAKDGESRPKTKKPTSFKSVSVTKHFLAKTAVAPPSKTGDKASPTPPTSSPAPTAKPRLVAKSGSGVGSAVPRSGLSRLNGASTPDPATVWNKNRPVPPPPPKQFTDEELKQQFGIHLATRLQADEDSKESKWADIEDDEEDWAPDTVEWMDGTKSTVKGTDEPPPPAEETKPEPPKEEKPVEDSKPPAPASLAPRPSSTSGSKTILKPGAAANQAKPGGLVLKGQPDKPTLVAKPSAPTPVKSPWAPLPPIEKVSPVVINPPVQHPQARFGHRDPHGFDALPPAPTKEIAADDFNRSWRDDRGPRELFNSHSGRYEPVKDSRRGSRPSENIRQPSVLQRPSQHAGPAEPSAAFQTSRTGPVDDPWSRRRSSSNVSGGRRMSFNRSHDMPPMDRRGSQVISDLPPPPIPSKAGYPPRGPFPERTLSPAASNQGSWTQRSSPVVTHAQPASPFGSAASPVPPESVHDAAAGNITMQDAVAIQEQTMREKIERAKAEKQKRREEEEREEAARKERLRLKLEAMGPPPPKTEKTTSPPPTTTAEPPKSVQSPPKPPVPTADGEVAQYGMMKVHQAHPVRKPAVHEDKHVSEPHLSAAGPGREARSPEYKPKSPARSPAAPAESVARSQDKTEALPSATPSAWKSSVQAEQNTVWSNVRARPIASNVWGPPNPNRERAIGNGTFAVVQPQGPAAPGPIAPPSTTSKLSTSPSHPTTQPPVVEQQPPPFPSPADARQPGQPSSTMAAGAVAMPPGPIAPPTGPSRRQPQPFDHSAWSANSIAEQDAQLARIREERFSTGPKNLPAFKETFKQTAIEGSLGPRRVLKTESVVHHFKKPASTPADATLQDSAIPSQHTDATSRSTSLPLSEPYRAPTTSEASPALAPIGSEKAQSSPGAPAVSQHPQSARSSRFFPRAQDAVESSAQQTTSASVAIDSPPPPETSSHPVFAGDVRRPVVKLPQKITVKLPPVSSQPPSVQMPARPGFPRFGSQPIVAQPGWQERINGLLGRPTMPSPPKPVSTALAVAPESKEPLDHIAHRASPSVSLPSKQNTGKAPAVTFIVGYDSSPASKPTVEDEFMSTPEAFSSPTVCLPKKAHHNAGLSPVPGPTSRPGSRFYKTPDVFSIDPMFITLADCEQNAQGFIINIRMPSSNVLKTKVMARRRNASRKSSGYNKKRNSAPRENGTGSTQPRSRKASGSPAQTQSAAASSRSSPSGAWGNTNRTNNPWNRRTSGAVH